MTETLWDKDRSSNPTFRDELISSNIGLVKVMAGDFPKWARDDCESAGYVKLVEVVDAWLAGRIKMDNPVAYLRQVIRNAMLAEVQSLKGHDTVPLDSVDPNAFAVEHTDFERVDLEDELSCCQTEREREIILLRLDGYTDQEIADKLDLSRQTVQRTRASVGQRYAEEKSLDLSC